MLIGIYVDILFTNRKRIKNLAFVVSHTWTFSKILEKFPGVNTLRALPQISRLLPHVQNSYMYNVYVFKQQHIEQETNYRDKRVLFKHYNPFEYYI